MDDPFPAFLIHLVFLVSWLPDSFFRFPFSIVDLALLRELGLNIEPDSSPKVHGGDKGTELNFCSATVVTVASFV
jgi:hypothetical protein